MAFLSRKRTPSVNFVEILFTPTKFSEDVPYVLPTSLLSIKILYYQLWMPTGQTGNLGAPAARLAGEGWERSFLFPQSLLDPPANGNLINCTIEIRRRGDIEDATWPRMEGANQPAPKERGNSKVATTTSAVVSFIITFWQFDKNQKSFTTAFGKIQQWI